MTDLEIIRLCAEAKGLDVQDQRGGLILADEILHIYTGRRYDPLHDDAQAMALVKKFPAECLSALQDYAHEHLMGRPLDLNRAICECVAKMQAAKHG